MKRSRIMTIIAAAALLVQYTGVALASPTPEQLRQTIRDYIAAAEQSKGAFSVTDPRSNASRTLKLVRVHERVGKTGDFYYSCTDMTDVQTNDLLDLDFDVSDNSGLLKVVDVRIHKDNGKPRYTYDANDKLIPLPA